MIASSLMVLALVSVGQAGHPDLYQDLRNQTPLLPAVRLTGPFVSKYTIPEAEGLRITLPAKRENPQPIALQTDFPVAGDFEITLTYELLAADVPEDPAKPAAVVGVNIYIVQGDDDKRFARLGRFNTWKRGHVYEIQHTDRHRERPTTMRRYPTEERAGQLRLARQGATLHFLVKDGATGDEFRELFRAEDFGADDLKVVRCAVNTTGLPCTVDARLIDFRIRSPNLPAAVIDPTPLAERHSYWWLATVIGLVVLTGSGIGLGALVRRRKQRGRQIEAKKHETAAATPSANGVVHVQCPACRKRLKVPGHVVGTKVKCPGCASAFVA